MNDHTRTPQAEARIIIPEIAVYPRANPDAVRVMFEGEAFATTWQVTLFADLKGIAGETTASLEVDLRRRAQAMLDQIDKEMSPYRGDSDLTRFNEAVAWSFVPLPPLMMTVVRHALEMAALTEGAFNPALLSAVELWGFGAKVVAPGLPEAASLNELHNPKHDWRDLIWQEDGMIRPEGLRLDLCAIAKGYAADALMRIARSHPGVCAGLVEVGGELKGWGVRPDGLPWWVETEAPQGAVSRNLIALCDWAVATSGDGRRSFVHDGQVLSHTIDARTQSPTTSTVCSATVFDPEGWRADALATALIVMGEEAAMAFAEAHDMPCLLWIRDAGGLRERLSPVLESWL